MQYVLDAGFFGDLVTPLLPEDLRFKRLQVDAMAGYCSIGCAVDDVAADGADVEPGLEQGQGDVASIVITFSGENIRML